MRVLKFVLGLANVAVLVVLFGGFCPAAVPYLAPLAKLQLVPAILSLDALALVIVLGLTLAFGRVYCETVCPLGVAQDALRILRWNRSRRVCSRLPESTPQIYVRMTFFFGFIVLGFCGLHFTWLDPYAIFGRAVGWRLQPDPSTAMTVFSLGLAGLVAVLALCGKGRVWCNWICPAGTLLHALVRFSWKRDRIEKGSGCDTCRACWKSVLPLKEEDAK